MNNGAATSDRHATLKGMSTSFLSWQQGGHDGFRVPFNPGQPHQFLCYG